MSSISVTPAAVAVRLSRRERLLGLLRDEVVPRSAITAVEVVPDGLAAVRGVRAPGFAWPGRRAIGTWRGRGKTLVDVRRGQPALRLALSGHRYDVLLVGTDDAPDLASRLRG